MSLREPLEHVTTCYKAFGKAFCALVEVVGGLEFDKVEPEDSDATIRKLRQRAEVAESRFAEAKAEIARLLKLRQWVGREQMDELRADAALGRLVRGMRSGSTLKCDPNRLSALRWWGLASYPYVCEKTADPAEALRAIQEDME